MSRLLGIIAALALTAFLALAPVGAFARGGGHGGGGGGGHFGGGFHGGGFHGGGFHGGGFPGAGFHGYYHVAPRVVFGGARFAGYGYPNYAGYGYPNYYGYGPYYPGCVVYTPYGPVLRPIPACYGYAY